MIEEAFGNEVSRMPDVSEYKDVIQEIIKERIEKNSKLSDELIPGDPL